MAFFADSFLQLFNAEEQQSDMVQKVSVIGANAEIAILQEVSTALAQASDFSSRTSEQLRSLLAFMFVQVRNYTAATGFITYVDGGKTTLRPNPTNYTIAAGTLLTTNSGLTFYTIYDQIIAPGSTNPIPVAQGSNQTFTGTYSGFIAIKVGNVDLSSISLYIGTTKLPAVSIQAGVSTNQVTASTSTDGHTWYTSSTQPPKVPPATTLYPIPPTSFSYGDVWLNTFSGVAYTYASGLWGQTAILSGLPKMEGVVSNPTNGYFAIYYGGTLYVRIYAGVDIPVFNGQAYTLQVAICDGAQGNVGAHNVTTFIPRILDNNQAVTYTIDNPVAMAGGIDAPTRSELLNTFLYWIYTKENVSGISDYRRFFLSQPGVIDCYVAGDYEDFVANGGALVLSDPSNPASPVVWNKLPTITGMVRAALVMLNGSSPQGASPTASQLRQIDTALSSVRDVGFCNYVSFGITLHIFTVRYISVQQLPTFQALMTSLISGYYDVTYLSSIGLSIFDNLDLSTLISLVPFSLKPVGLELLHEFLRSDKLSPGALQYTLTSVDGFYSSSLALGSTVYKIKDSLQNTLYEFVEVYNPTSPKVYNIVQVIGGQPTTTVLGTHDYTSDAIALNIGAAASGGAPANSTMQLRATPKNQAVISAGKEYNTRALAADPDIPGSSLLVNFEAYSL